MKPYCLDVKPYCVDVAAMLADVKAQKALPTDEAAAAALAGTEPYTTLRAEADSLAILGADAMVCAAQLYLAQSR